MRISIIGDSFSSDEQAISWISLLKKQHQVTNYSLRGISQYRIFKITKTNLADILLSDAVIFWHTNPDRVFVNNEVTFPTRDLASHPSADLIATDSLSSNNSDWKKIVCTYYKFFFDQEQQELYYRLLIKELIELVDGVKIKIHCSGFKLKGIELPTSINQFDEIKSKFPGNINHMNESGNLLVYKELGDLLA